MDSSAETLAAVRRSNQVYYGQLAEPVTLACGIALLCPKYPRYHDGNQLREAVVPPDRSLAEAFEEVRRCYSEQGLTCYRWVPAAGQASEPIGAFLAERGYVARRNLVMRWRREVDMPLHPAVKVLSARAMKRALRTVMLDSTTHEQPVREMLADVAVDLLDEPSFDFFVATLDGRPAGYGGLLQAGDIGRIEKVFIAEHFRRQGVGRTLLAHLLALSRRLALRITCLEVAEDNTEAQALYRACGLEVEGAYVQFVAPEALTKKGGS